MPVRHQQVILRDAELRHRLPLVVMDEPVHEHERFALREDFAGVYVEEGAHFQKS